MITIDKVRKLATIMREVGAVRVKVEGLEIELGPPPPAPQPPAREERPEPEPLPCPCGHPADEHSDAGCLQGCSLETCAGSGQHPQPEEA